MSKAATTAIAKLKNKPQSLQALQDAMEHNIWAVPARDHPNADRLKDGALQRLATTPNQEHLQVKANPEKIGFFKREELNEKASSFGVQWSTIWNLPQEHRYRVARVYQPQRKHVHYHPANKEVGKFWVIEFESWGNYKSPLMFWTTGSLDSLHRQQIKVPNLYLAIKYCETMGWGYDVQYPRHRWHTRKSYADNFIFKGEPKEEEAYD